MTKPSENNTVTLPDGRTLGFAVYGVPLSATRLSSENTGSEQAIAPASRWQSSSPFRKTSEENAAKDSFPTVIYCHGVPGSRFEVAHLHEHALTKGVRILAIDRPGIGNSSPSPQRTILDFAKDTKFLLNHLQIPRFHVLVYSGGSPYAYGLAYACHSRQQGNTDDTDGHKVLSVNVVAGLAPWPVAVQSLDVPQRILANIAYWCPTIIQYLLKKEVACFAGQDVSEPAQLTSSSRKIGESSNATAPDYHGVQKMQTQTPLSSEEIREVFVRHLRQVHNGEMKWVLEDVHLVTSDWGFDLRKLKPPKSISQNEKRSAWIKLWHGGRDDNVKLARSEALRGLFSQSLCGSSASLTVLPSDTHFTILLQRGGYILDSLFNV
ncbi:alpha/beta-hydrolase [Cystobasidium minutum MCA 4210]|uniref:alpha/beta-hydrolase n=1 Tax=Cystobasidium minutum MCA 4210 TaxID=1397322 RepID=UPI0034D018BA|eukprot:jgi/Rhomi1/211105/estExt_Genemark1.C_4_t20234